MITAVVQFTLSDPMPGSKLAELSAGNAPMYQDKPGLIRKYYVGSEDGLRVGGIYLWESREAAEAVYDDAWLERVTDAYGSTPTITWYDTPVVVDNRAGEIVV
ncbi:MAG: monooxygenase [Ilumatobacter sp.]|nr:monooxygenase [Ilumatobacter sp.]